MAKLRVERVEEEDRELICQLARMAHEESLFADIPFSTRKFNRAFDTTQQVPDKYLGLKVSLGGEVVGFCYALLGRFYIGEEAQVVTVIALVTSSDVRSRLLGGRAALRLTRGIEAWAKAMGASHVLYHATSGTNPANSDRFFRKLGMTTLGGSYGYNITVHS